MPSLVRQSESGNGLVIILIAIALLVSLTAMMTRSSGTSDDTGDQERLTLQATKILRYAQSLENAVQSLLMRGCSENQISFQYDVDGDGDYNDNDESPNYFNPNAPNDLSCHIFRPEGGGVNHIAGNDLPYGDGTAFNYGNNRNIAGIGTTNNDASSTDLTFLWRTENEEMCHHLNRLSGNTAWSTIPLVACIAGVPYRGTFLYANTCTGAFTGIKTGCYNWSSLDTKYYFYHVILAR